MPLLLHTINYDFKKLKEAGCQLVDPPALFHGLMEATMGDPCTTGCAFFNGGKCPAYLKFHSQPIGDAARQEAQRRQDRIRASTDQSGLIGGRWAGMTTKQIREAEGGISPAEFAKRKQAGKYKE